MLEESLLKLPLSTFADEGSMLHQAANQQSWTVLEMLWAIGLKTPTVLLSCTSYWASHHPALLRLLRMRASQPRHQPTALFQEALDEAPQTGVEVVRACKAGAARCTIQAGDIRRGVALALRSGSKAVMRDCAAILTGGRGRGAGTSMEAAELYEAAGDAEQAVAVYLDAKAITRVEPLMQHVTTPKLILAVRSSYCMIQLHLTSRESVPWIVRKKKKEDVLQRF